LMFVVDATDRVVFYEKDGINAGASGVIRHYPEDDLTVVILSNMEKGAWGPIARVHEWVVGSHSR
jgi:hypothetical protein